MLIKNLFNGCFALGGTPIPSSSASLPAGSTRAGRSAETASWHISSICHPIRSRLSHPTAWCCGAGTYQAAHHSAGKEKGIKKSFWLKVVEILHSLTFLFNTRLESKTLKSLMTSWIHWAAGLLRPRRLWTCMIPTAPVTWQWSKTAWRSSRSLHFFLWQSVNNFTVCSEQ